jgi:DNA-binding CsgD family transcriptional regulator
MCRRNKEREYIMKFNVEVTKNEMLVLERMRAIADAQGNQSDASKGDRNSAMIALKGLGATLDEIGGLFDITGSSVHNTLKRMKRYCKKCVSYEHS